MFVCLSTSTAISLKSEVYNCQKNKSAQTTGRHLENFKLVIDTRLQVQSSNQFLISHS